MVNASHISPSAINALILATKFSELVNVAMATFPHPSNFSLRNENISSKIGDMR